MMFGMETRQMAGKRQRSGTGGSPCCSHYPLTPAPQSFVLLLSSPRIVSGLTRQSLQLKTDSSGRFSTRLALEKPGEYKLVSRVARCGGLAPGPLNVIHRFLS